MPLSGFEPATISPIKGSEAQHTTSELRCPPPVRMDKISLQWYSTWLVLWYYSPYLGSLYMYNIVMCQSHKYGPYMGIYIYTIIAKTGIVSLYCQCYNHISYSGHHRCSEKYRFVWECTWARRGSRGGGAGVHPPYGWGEKKLQL